MSKRLLLVATVALAGAAVAGNDRKASGEQTEEMNPLPRHFPTKERFEKEHAAKSAAKAKSDQNLVYHGGPVIHSARVVPIFWGPSWGSSDASIASHIQSFFGQFGNSAEYNTI